MPAINLIHCENFFKNLFYEIFESLELDYSNDPKIVIKIRKLTRKKVTLKNRF